MQFVLLVLTNPSLGVLPIEAEQCFNFVLHDVQLCEDIDNLTIMVCWIQIYVVHGTSELNMIILAGLSILAVAILNIKMNSLEACSGFSLCELNGSFVQDNIEGSTGGSASCEESCLPSKDMKIDVDFADERLDKGIMQCSHYRRRCCIRAPCCNEVFNCRHCHNEAKNSIDVESMHRHDMPRQELQQVICLLCGTEQEVRQVCISCGVCMGKYFCATCKLFDDDISKQQYHCNGCGICRIGGRENFFHCFTCGCCYSILLKNSHPCVQGAMHHDCPVCFEYLFESTNDVSVLPCGHTIHVHCLKEMQQHFQYACPLCSKSVCDMSKVWEVLDMEVAATPMPESKMVRILCNDCGATSDVQFHVVAQKCLNCKSYNTRQM